MTTCKGQHQLIAIYTDGPEMQQAVVRWCQACGAVTIDLDVDGRTAPGDVMAMRLPEIEANKQGK